MNNDSGALAPTSAQRPRALVLAVSGGVLVAVLTLLAMGLGLAGGRQAIEDALRSDLGLGSGSLPALVGAAIDDGYQTLQARATLGIVIAVLVLLFALLAARGALWARIVLAVVLLVNLGLLLRAVTDVFPGIAKAVGTLAVLVSVAVMAAAFLPGIGRYRQERRAGTAAVSASPL